MNRTQGTIVDLPRRAERRPSSDFERLIDEIESQEETRKEEARPRAEPAQHRERRPFPYD